MGQSPFQLAKDIQVLVQGRLHSQDIDSMPAIERDLLRKIKRRLADIRLDIRDYGTAETASEQRQKGKAGLKNLDALQRELLEASDYGVFGAADVAIVSAHIQQLMVELKE